ncbi:MAG: AraC family transcriptional regulator [Clostridia bacterium]|nr:AraC family transcriptional regulator [Clostridia bacterium]
MNFRKCYEKIEIPDGLLDYQWNKNFYFHKHNHDFWEFSLVCKGSYQQIINGKKVSMQPNHAVLLRPDDTHQFLPSDPDDYHLKVLMSCNLVKRIYGVVSDNLYDEMLNANFPFMRLHPSEVNNINKYITYMETLQNQKSKLISTKIALAQYILNTAYLNSLSNNNSYPKVVHEFILEMSKPQNLALNVNEVIAMINYSYSHFEKIFKKATNMSLHQFITKQKINYAMNALTETDIDILELSNFLGYSSLSHFYKIFKKHCNVSPASYRRAHKE